MSRKHKHPPAEARFMDRLVVMGCLAGLLAIAAFFSLKLNSFPKSGPNLIDADGVEYLACGGAVWLRDEGNARDLQAANYFVTFKDAEGATHTLKRVRALKVTDLASNDPCCAYPQ
jgi:hypothetical protein